MRCHAVRNGFCGKDESASLQIEEFAFGSGTASVRASSVSQTENGEWSYIMKLTNFRGVLTDMLVETEKNAVY